MESDDSNECAPIATGSTSKHQSENSEEDEPLRKIPKMSVPRLLSVATASKYLHDKGTKLHEAVLSNDANAVRAVLQSDPNLIDEKDSHGKTALHQAAKGGHGGIVKMLLDKGASTNLQDLEGRTPLHDMLCNIWNDEVVSMQEDYIGVMKKLLAAGADAHLQDEYNQTPLHIALCSRNNTAAEMIVDERGGNNLQDKRGKTPLHLAIESQHSLEIAKKLLTAGVSTRIRDNQGNTPLHIALDSRAEANAVNNFVEADSDNDVQDGLGRTPLRFAVRQGRILAARMLLYCGAHPHVKAKFKDDPLGIELYPLGVALKERRSAVAKIIVAACVLQDIVIDWEKDLHLKSDYMSSYIFYERTYTVKFYQDLYAEYDLEVQKMKNTKLNGTTITYYNLARKHERKLAPYLKNKDICSVLQSTKLDNHFPNYGRWIAFKVKRARKRNALIVSCLKCFSVLSKKFPSLLKINTDSILDFLNQRDLINFASAFNIGSKFVH